MKEEENLKRNIKGNNTRNNSTGKNNTKNGNNIKNTQNKNILSSNKNQDSSMKSKITIIHVLVIKIQMMEELFKNLKNILIKAELPLYLQDLLTF